MPYLTFYMEEWPKESSEWRKQYSIPSSGQLPITSITAHFHLGMNRKRVFDDSHDTWCQTLQHIFCGALAALIMPFIEHILSFLSNNLFHSNQKFTNHNSKYLNVISLVPIDWQLSSLGRVSTSCTPKLDLPKLPSFCIPENDHLTPKCPLFERLKIAGCSFHRSPENSK